MIESYRPLSRLLMAAAVLGAVGAGPLARAQDVAVPAASPDDLDEEDEGPEAVAPAQPAFVLNDSQFDQWAFNGRNAASIRSRFDSLLMLQIANIDRICGISDEQKKKLRLAGRGDIKRYFDRVEEKRRKFQGLKSDPNKVNEIFQELQPFQATLNTGPFDDDSIFSKTLRRTLDEAQVEKFDKGLREKNLRRYRARVDLMVTTLGNNAGLSAKQRKRFREVILEETRPPRNFGAHDYQVVLYQAAQLPAETLKPIFDEAQWRVVDQQLMQQRGMGQFLKDNGYVPDPEGPTPDRPATAPREID